LMLGLLIFFDVVWMLLLFAVVGMMLW
jgi:hypothetical protein